MNTSPSWSLLITKTEKLPRLTRPRSDLANWRSSPKHFQLYQESEIPRVLEGIKSYPLSHLFSAGGPLTYLCKLIFQLLFDASSSDRNHCFPWLPSLPFRISTRNTSFLLSQNMSLSLISFASLNIAYRLSPFKRR